MFVLSALIYSRFSSVPRSACWSRGCRLYLPVGSFAGRLDGVVQGVLDVDVLDSSGFEAISTLLLTSRRLYLISIVNGDPTFFVAIFL